MYFHFNTSTLDLLKKTIDNKKKSFAALAKENPSSVGDSGNDQEAEMEDPRPVISGDRSVRYEELRRSLHRRIEELRGNRNTRTLNMPKDDKREKRKKNKMQNSKGGEASQGKRKRYEESGKDGHDDVKKKEDKKAKFDVFSYGLVKLMGMEEKGMKKRKFSKQQELDKAKKLADAKKDPEKGNMIAEKHSWWAAMSRAVGEKVHDDSKVLGQSLRKEQKRHQKHAEKWKERIESQNKFREEKQKTRAENIIRERIQRRRLGGLRRGRRSSCVKDLRAARIHISTSEGCAIPR